MQRWIKDWFRLTFTGPLTIALATISLLIVFGIMELTKKTSFEELGAWLIILVLVGIITAVIIVFVKWLKYEVRIFQEHETAPEIKQRRSRAIFKVILLYGSGILMFIFSIGSQKFGTVHKLLILLFATIILGYFVLSGNYKNKLLMLAMILFPFIILLFMIIIK